VYPLTEESLEEEGGEEPGHAHQHRDECANLKKTEYAIAILIKKSCISIINTPKLQNS
jgi:hypothetical protein